MGNMLALNTKRKMFIALQKSINRDPGWWTPENIRIAYNAIKRGKILSGEKRKNMGYISNRFYILEGYDRNIKLAIVINKEDAFTSDFIFDAYIIDEKQYKKWMEYEGRIRK